MASRHRYHKRRNMLLVCRPSLSVRLATNRRRRPRFTRRQILYFSTRPLANPTSATYTLTVQLAVCPSVVRYVLSVVSVQFFTSLSTRGASASTGDCSVQPQQQLHAAAAAFRPHGTFPPPRGNIFTPTARFSLTRLQTFEIRRAHLQSMHVTTPPQIGVEETSNCRVPRRD